jgi:hypothetical protein
MGCFEKVQPKTGFLDTIKELIPQLTMDELFELRDVVENRFDEMILGSDEK